MTVATEELAHGVMAGTVGRPGGGAQERHPSSPWRILVLDGHLGVDPIHEGLKLLTLIAVAPDHRGAATAPFHVFTHVTTYDVESLADHIARDALITGN